VTRKQGPLKPFLTHLFVLLSHHGGMGLLVVGLLDSSILTMPLGNDLLIIVMSTRDHKLIPYYAAMAAAGSVLGCLTVDLLVRKGGEKEIEKHVSRKRFEYVKKRMNKNAAWALAFASLMPPPFPFTPFVAAAAALQYPRRKLLSVIGAARLVRFSIEGTLAFFIGRRLIRVAQSSPFEYAVGALIFLCVVGSAISIYRWIRQSKADAPRRQSAESGAK
jgi:membrane protein YqaA with SNARE-associated domain